MFPPLSESCRMVQGSRQEIIHITFEQRTEPKELGCAGFRPILRMRVSAFSRNKSGTAEVYAPLSLSMGQRRFFF